MYKTRTKKCNKGLVYIAYSGVNAYLIRQQGQRTWVAMLLNSEYEMVSFIGNSKKILELIDVTELYTSSIREEIRRGIMCVMVGKKPDSNIEASTDDYGMVTVRIKNGA